MSVEDMPDERLVRFYENVRQQVEADRAGNHKFMMNPTVQQYADQLQSEMIKRGWSIRQLNGRRKWRASIGRWSIGMVSTNPTQWRLESRR
jgi:hypothetical protein